MTDALSDAEVERLEALAESDEPWAEAVTAYLAGLKEVDKA